MSLRALAQRSGISQYLIVDFEHSRRLPTSEQYEKLRTVLELGEITPAGTVLSSEHVTILAACLVWSHGLPLATLAAAAQLTEAEVRQGIESIRDPLALVGVEVSVDQNRARVNPLSWTDPPVRTAIQPSSLTDDEMTLMAVLYRYPGNAATFAALEVALARGVRSLLAGLSDRGLVDFIAEGKVAERRYWITDLGLMSVAAQTLRALGVLGNKRPPGNGTTD